MQRIFCGDFNLAATLSCGQVFHWDCAEDGWWSGLAGGERLVLRQEAEHLVVRCGRGATVRRYFALDHDLPAITATFPTDDTMTAAAAFCRGLRLIRQPRWECLATFITSSMKQVAHIRQMSLALRTRYGRPVAGSPCHAYPAAEVLAAASEAGLRACGLGYRAANLRATAAMVAGGEAPLDDWAQRDDEALRQALCGLPGVGRKVANCVMLFAFERLGAFPVDTWISRIVRQHYWRGRARPTPRLLEMQTARRFGPYAGYAQQYLFHHARMSRNPRRREAA